MVYSPRYIYYTQGSNCIIYLQGHSKDIYAFKYIIMYNLLVCLYYCYINPLLRCTMPRQ